MLYEILIKKYPSLPTSVPEDLGQLTSCGMPLAECEKLILSAHSKLSSRHYSFMSAHVSRHAGLSGKDLL
jgi:hypothetical protein